MHSRRNLLASSVTLAMSLPLAGLAAEVKQNGPGSNRKGDKCTWTLIRPEGVGIVEFQQYILNDLAKAAGRLLSGTSSIWVTLQEPNAFSGAMVRVGHDDLRVDAVLQITSSDSYVATDPVNSVLTANCGHVQGWRVHPTTIYDLSTPVPLGARLRYPQTLWINQRLDGTTPEFYSRNWYIHGHHPDGREAESDQSRAIQAQQAGAWQGRRYIQNRVLEPITPTAWVVNGYTDLLLKEFLSGPGERYDPKAGMGEEMFDKWPPKLIQGYAYRVL